MTRRQFLAAPAALAASPARKPNIVVIFLDDVGYGELGFQGNHEIPTPYIDSVAQNGVRFTSGYVTAPVCSPSRAGLMTGRYQARFGHEANPIGKQNLRPELGLPLSEVTLAERLKQAGYATGLVGKWHLGGTPKYHPQRRGFDEFFGFLHEGHFYAPPPYRGMITRLLVQEPPYDEANPILRGESPVEEKEYLTRAFAREALAFIDRHERQPFFLYLALNGAHSPMQAPTEYVRRFQYIHDEQRRLYAAMLACCDEGVGAVLARLREKGLESDTLVFLLSDNGGPTQELTSSNLPLHGGKGQLSEGGIRIPFCVQWKGRLPAGKIYHQPVISLDIHPTAAAAAGLGPERKLDGVDLVPYLTGTTAAAPHERLFWRTSRRGQSAVRQGRYKLLTAKDTTQLYDLEEDLSETRDLAAARPDLVKQLADAYSEWSAGL